MSRLGRTPVPVPSGVEVTINGRTVAVKGKLGSLDWTIPTGITAALEDNQVTFTAAKQDRRHRAMWGLARALVNNMVVGVSEGYEKRLAIVGVGYLADKQGQNLVLHVGRANAEVLEIPQGIDVEVAGKGLSVYIKGCDKQLVGEFAARTRRVHPPEAYKGKGVRYEGEQVKIKPGKQLVGGGK
ncbi:MAG: 50S ribosomal protein L6 [Planctomycetota bacterium]|jgi:large subunit ribosomal protein L6